MFQLCAIMSRLKFLTTARDANMNILYLNNTGSRWISYTDSTHREKSKLKLSTSSGKVIERTVIFWESFGNFAVACISYKGKKIKVFADQVLED